MKYILMIISYVALVMLVIFPVCVYLQRIELATSKWGMLVATILWFGTAPFWMKRNAQ